MPANANLSFALSPTLVPLLEYLVKWNVVHQWFLKHPVQPRDGVITPPTELGLGMELDAIAAVAVGGTLLSGGRATITGTLIGALIIQLVRYTMLANGVPDDVAKLAKAALIVAAVWLQSQGRA